MSDARFPEGTLEALSSAWRAAQEAAGAFVAASDEAHAAQRDLETSGIEAAREEFDAASTQLQQLLLRGAHEAEGRVVLLGALSHGLIELDADLNTDPLGYLASEREEARSV